LQSPGCTQAAGYLSETFNSAEESVAQPVGPEHAPPTVAHVLSTRNSSRGESSRRAPAAELDFVEPEHYAIGKSVEHYITKPRKRQKKSADKAVAVDAESLWETKVVKQTKSKQGYKEVLVWYLNRGGEAQEQDCPGWLRTDGLQEERTIHWSSMEVPER